ncbi:hypothetical protein MMC11_006864 [Xylographa trunciseda]|nr:hypothetical protein [Xylographa trunciseda]
MEQMLACEHGSPASLDLANEKAGTEEVARGAASDNAADAVSMWSLADGRGGRWFLKMGRSSFARRCWRIISYTPARCRWDAEETPRFSLGLNLLFAFAATFSVANLYYNHPILNILARDFGVSYERASLVPTVMQAGYATGLLFLCPLGDVFRRRAFVLTLTWLTATVWLALCLTSRFEVFAALSFIASVTTVTPQLMLPLVGDLAPPEKRAHALSLVVSGLLAGILVARILSGVVTQYSSWRNVYWIAFAMQYLIVILLWFFMPDYPVTNSGGLNYLKMLWEMVLMLTKHPVLVQACLIGFFTSATFANYWTTLTFLLAEPPYSYSSLVIGCFAFIGLGAVVLVPLYAKSVIDRFVPLFSIVLGESICLTGVIIGTYTGTFTVAGPIIQALAIDVGLQTTQIANRAAIFTLEPKARNRLNTVFMVSVFSGQLMGTGVGNIVYAQGGWIQSGSVSVGFVCASLVVSFVRGPWNEGWIGWKGGWNLRRRDLRNSQE